jgi:hypothetical protein
MQLVLDDLEGALRVGRRRFVVGRQREDVAHAQVHSPLAGADVADALEQLVEVVGHARPRRALQPFVIEHEALDQVLLETSGGPLAELRAARAADAVADGEDDGQAVMVDRSSHLARPSNRTIRNFRIVASWTTSASP